MSVYLRAAIVALLVALGFLAGRLTNAPQRAPDALAAFPDAPQSLVAVQLPPEAMLPGAERTRVNFAAQVDSMPVAAIDPVRIAPSSAPLTPPSP